MTEEEKTERLKELENKITLTDAEMMEKLSLSPSGRYKLLPNVTILKLKDNENALNNIIFMSDKIKKSMEDGYYIEAISLILLFTDIWLRMFIIAKDNNKPEDLEKIYMTNHKGDFPDNIGFKSFGNLIKECEKRNFNKDLIGRLYQINKLRNEAIHRFTLDGIKYDDLKTVCSDFSFLSKDISKYVAQEIGLPIIIKNIDNK